MKMQKLTVNPREYKTSTILAIVESLASAGYQAARPLAVAETGEEADYAEVITALFPTGFKTGGKTYPIASILANLPKVTGGYVVDGRHRAVACAVASACGLWTGEATVCKVTDESYSLTGNAIEMALNRLTGLDIVRQAHKLKGEGKVTQEADLMKLGVKRGTAQRAYMVSELCTLAGCELAAVENLTYLQAKEVRAVVQAGVPLTDALKKLDATDKKATPLSTAAVADLVKYCKEHKADSIAAVLQAVIDGSKITAVLAIDSALQS